MNHGRMSDLQNALNFVSRRIEEEGVRSSRPLTDDQRFLLANLPSEPVLSEAYSVDPDYPPLVTPRELDYEELCTLSKDAYQQDIQLNPVDKNWLFAKAVTEFHEHPMSWVLGWAGVKLRRPWWDRCLLILAAIASIIICVVLMSFAIDGHLWFRWAVFAGGMAVLIALMRSGTRWMVHSQLSRAIERYRQA